MYEIEAIGNVTIIIRAPEGYKVTMTLIDVVYVPNFMLNIVSLTRLMAH